MEEIITPTKVPNLHFITNGPIPPNPVTLLSTSRAGLLFEELKASYDYVIIDSPPFGLVTDAFLLMQYTDINLFVTRLGIITKRALRQSIEDLNEKKIKNVYNVLNDITKLDKAYTHKYYQSPVKKRSIGSIILGIFNK